MADLTTEQLAAMLKKLDDVCEQARLLSKQIQKQMGATPGAVSNRLRMP